MKTIPTTEYPGFVYQEKGNRHNYFLDGKLMTGVTTFLKVAGDKEGLQVWYANLATAKAFLTGTPSGFKENYDAVIKKLGKLTSEGARELDKLHPEFKEARLAAMGVRDDAADVGKAAHKFCEETEKGNIVSVEETIALRAKPYLDWYEKNIEKTHFVEKPLFSKSMFAGGTPDGGFLTKDGKNLINDKKFKNSIHDPSAFWQMAAYRMMIEEMAQDNETPVRLELADDSIETYKSSKEYLGSIGGLTWDGSVVILIDGSGDVKPTYRYAYEEDLEVFKSAVKIKRAIDSYKIPWHN